MLRCGVADRELDPVMSVLLAQLSRNGILSPADLDNMKRRLIEGGDDDLAHEVNMALLSDVLDDPEERRASIHVIRSDGGNGTA